MSDETAPVSDNQARRRNPHRHDDARHGRHPRSGLDVLHSASVFQRSQQGHDEILRKTHRLTPLERRILLLTDGVASVFRLRAAMKTVSTERFMHAMQTLFDAGMIAEVLHAPPGRLPDTVCPETASRFLMQDVLDPPTRTDSF